MATRAAISSSATANNTMTVLRLRVMRCAQKKEAARSGPLCESVFALGGARQDSRLQCDRRRTMTQAAICRRLRHTILTRRGPDEARVRRGRHACPCRRSRTPPMPTGHVTAATMRRRAIPHSRRSIAATSASSRSPGNTTPARKATRRRSPSSSAARCTATRRRTRRLRSTPRPASNCGCSIPASRAWAPTAA